MIDLPTLRKLKVSFTLAPESLAFVKRVRAEREARSDSEALDLLLRQMEAEAKQKEIDRACAAYYDSASDSDLREEAEWAEGTALAMWDGIAE